MGVKRKAQEAAAADGGSVDWRSYPRRPFKRGFIEYINVSVRAAEAANRRAAAGIKIVGDGGIADTPPPAESFEELGILPPWLLEALREDECYEPTPIQAQSLPIALAGQNLIGVTVGSRASASLAYLLPAAVHIEDQPPLAEMDPGPIALVVAPTRELAVQISKDAAKVFQHSKRSSQHSGGIQAVCIHEGGSRKEQLKQLGTAGAHVIAGTPGRLYDLAAKDQLPLLRVTFLVIDCADKLIELGLSEQVRGLAAWIRPERQTLLFSSTWPKAAQDLAAQLCYAGGDPVHISTGAKRRGNSAAGKSTAKAQSGTSAAQADGDAQAEAEAEAEVNIEDAGEAEAVNGAPAEGDFPDDW
mmetsp:Transcript_136822/g.222674  ORF Transcript_136822/g.222674 Transcript_136822/m.222674 type:complete len:358 (+) Transcript_136822:90-1163(+)